MNELVTLAGHEPMTNTRIIGQGISLDHRSVIRLVDRYKERLEKKGVLRFEITKPLKGENNGRPVRFAWLNEDQAYFLITLMRNSEVVLDFKERLTGAFVKQRKIIAQLLTQRQNLAWLEQRDQGKVSRRAQTDTIKEFVEYAKNQGSTSAKFYYPNISTMENQALFILEERYPNVRDVLSGQQLQIIASADLTVKRALEYGMEQKMHYRDIYEMAKRRIYEFADLVGQTPVPKGLLGSGQPQSPSVPLL